MYGWYVNRTAAMYAAQAVDCHVVCCGQAGCRQAAPYSSVITSLSTALQKEGTFSVQVVSMNVQVRCNTHTHAHGAHIHAVLSAPWKCTHEYGCLPHSQQRHKTSASVCKALKGCACSGQQVSTARQHHCHRQRCAAAAAMAAATPGLGLRPARGASAAVRTPPERESRRGVPYGAASCHGRRLG